MRVRSFEELLEEGLTAPISGWDFSFLRGRSEAEPLPWSYPARVAAACGAGPMLDMGTGGGEVLSRLQRPARTVATEAWAPNVPVAAGRLARLGIPVVRDEGAVDNGDQDATRQRGKDGARGRLPFRDAAFQIVVNRHEAFLASEVSRVLAPGGWFVTQQVDRHTYDEFRSAFGLPPVPQLESWLPLARSQVEDAGLVVSEAEEAEEREHFHDVGALVYYLRMVSWAVPGVDLPRCRPALRRLHEQMAEAPFTVRQRRLLLVARKP
jgi:SAM-dependent methyltransferase